MKNLGTNQISCLEALADHGAWYPSGGWKWNSYSITLRIMEGLARRGLVKNTGQPAGSREERYVLTNGGQEFLNERKRLKPPQEDVNEALLTAYVDGEGEWRFDAGYWVKSAEYTKLCMGSLVADGYAEKRPEGRWVLTVKGRDRAIELGALDRLAMYDE